MSNTQPPYHQGYVPKERNPSLLPLFLSPYRKGFVFMKSLRSSIKTKPLYPLTPRQEKKNFFSLFSKNFSGKKIWTVNTNKKKNFFFHFFQKFFLEKIPPLMYLEKIKVRKFSEENFFIFFEKDFQEKEPSLIYIEKMRVQEEIFRSFFSSLRPQLIRKIATKFF